MTAWVEKQPMTRAQAAVVGLWLVQVNAIRWTALPAFVWRRGVVKGKVWYDD